MRTLALKLLASGAAVAAALAFRAVNGRLGRLMRKGQGYGTTQPDALKMLRRQHLQKVTRTSLKLRWVMVSTAKAKSLLHVGQTEEQKAKD
jgi:hypothetical protein